jgi:hypothetical protein
LPVPTIGFDKLTTPDYDIRGQAGKLGTGPSTKLRTGRALDEVEASIKRHDYVRNPVTEELYEVLCDLEYKIEHQPPIPANPKPVLQEDAEVECPAYYCSPRFEFVNVPEVVPQAQRDRGKL